MDDADWARIRRLAEDWTTIWQSEMAARGSDPEIGETVQAVFEAWLGAADVAYRPWWRPHDPRPHGPAPADPRADAAAGAAAADAASRARDDEIRRLRQRLDRLERRLEPAADVRVDTGLAGSAGPDEPAA